ncbi:hypothetical protein KDU74_21100 [Enterobacter cloacae]|nr:hypothetical protein [Enterobacter cloacae]QUG51237.1 hypothetical protein KDU74_21100 [Enterobacter cloacae]
MGYFDGMASVLEGMYLIENDELMVFPQDLFCAIPIAKLGAPYVGEDRPVLSVDDILIRPVYAYCYDAQPIVLSMNDVYLSRGDIELIYNCGVQGKDLPEDRLTVSESIKAKPKIRETAKQSREGANKQVISSQADSLIKISRIWADFFPANTSNQPI